MFDVRQVAGFSRAIESSAAWAGAGPAVVTFGVVCVVGISSDGPRPVVWRLGSLALLALAAAALLARERIELGRPELAMLAALAALAAWTAASAWWSIHPSLSTLEAERTLFYVAGLSAFLLGVDRTSLPQVVAAAVAGVTAVSAVGLGERYLTPQAYNPIEGPLLIQPIGYANALGMYVALGILLATGLALKAHRQVGRLAALASLVVLVPTLALTSSRGAWIALALGGAAMLYFGRRVRSHALLVSLLAVGIVGGVAIGSNSGQALSLVGEYRPHYWHVALNEWQASPFLGDGAGTFGDYFWRYHRPAAGFALDAHNLYLQSLAELGPLGLGLLVVALCLPLIALRGRQDTLVAAAGGAYVAFLVHVAIDWEWEIPAVTLVALLCGGSVLVGTRGERDTLSPRARSVLLACVILLTGVVAVRLATGRGLGAFS